VLAIQAASSDGFSRSGRRAPSAGVASSAQTRKAWRVERVKDKLANPHAPLDAAAAAVRELAPEMTPGEARTLAQRAVAWTAQAHNAWLFGRSGE